MEVAPTLPCAARPRQAGEEAAAFRPERDGAVWGGPLPGAPPGTVRRSPVRQRQSPPSSPRTSRTGSEEGPQR